MRIAVIGLRGVPHVIGGIESHCERLYPHLAGAYQGFDIWLLPRRRFTAAGTMALGRAKVRALWAPKATAFEAGVHTVLAILYARFRLGADLVHLHGIGPGFFSPLAKFLGLCVVVTHHAADFARPKWGRFARNFLKAGEALAARAADRIICVSDALEHEFLARHPLAGGRTTTITHGVPEEGPGSADAAEVLGALGLQRGGYVLAVGRLDETKRFHDLISAVDRAASRALPLVIVGASVDGSAYAEALQAQAGAKVIFAGYRYGHELKSLYEGAALLIHPSEMEGFGLVVLEALSNGTPVMVSDIPPHREFGLPEAAYFAVGDIEAIRRAIEGRFAPPRSPELFNAIRACYAFEASVDAHVRVFNALAPRSAGDFAR